MQNRMAWVLGGVTAVAAVTAVGVGFNGYRDTPHRADRSVRPAANTLDADPLAPRLFDQNGPIRIHVAGAVRSPGVYSLPNWARVIDAIKKAGGATPNADMDAINLADRIRDAEQLRVPYKTRRVVLQAHRATPEPPPVVPARGGHGLGRYPFTSAVSNPHAVKEAQSGPVNLNTASKEDLDGLPGVGPTTAEKIVSYRQEHGPFLRPEDVMNVKGIGPKKFARLRDAIAAP